MSSRVELTFETRSTNGRSASTLPDLAEKSNLTRSQFLMWLGQKLQPEIPLYDMMHTFTIEGAIDVDMFRQAFQMLVDRSDAMRTIVKEVDGVPQQIVLPELAYDVALIDFSNQDDPEALLLAWLLERRQRTLVLAECLFDSSLIKLARNRYVWYFNQHHIMTDAWSVTLIYRYVAEYYALASRGRLAQAGPIPPYDDYVRYESGLRGSEEHDDALAYWRQKVAAPVDETSFFGDPVIDPSPRTERVTCVLDQERTRKLKEIAAEEGIQTLSLEMSLFSMFAAFLITLMHRTGGQRRLRLGTPFHNRRTPDAKKTIGLFIEVGHLQVELDPGETFLTLIEKVQDELFYNLRYAQPGISSAVGNNAYDVLLNYVNASTGDFAGLPATTQWIHSGYGDAAHKLRLQVHDLDDAGRFVLHFDLNCDLFEETKRSRVTRHFLRIVDCFIEQWQRPIGNFTLIEPAEARVILHEFNRTSMPNPAGQSVVTMFEAQAARAPEAVAATNKDRRLTYGELNSRANQLARRLRAQGAGPEKLVAVFTERSFDTLVALLGVLKSGAAYVPIDASVPPERLAYILNDTQVSIVLTQVKLQTKLDAYEGLIWCLDDERMPVPSSSLQNLSPTADASNLAYVIYTSGSTGRPKGTMIHHQGLTNYVSWALATYTRGQTLAFPLYSSLAFDLTITSIFVPLVSGGRIVIYSEADHVGGTEALQVIEDNLVDVMKLTPAHLAMIHALPVTAKRLQTLIVGGEDFKTDLAQSVQERFGTEVAIYNEYGPTETVVGCMIHRYDPESDNGYSVPIGKPVANARIHLLDPYLNPVPPGVIGEMYIGGDGVARGYLGRPKLSGERFLPNPFRPGERMYRTGDLARWTAPGAIEFLGRADYQVKIRGARIELGEVEAALLTYPEISQCVAAVVQYEQAVAPATVTHCFKCGLPSNYPDASFDDQGICNMCLAYDRFAGKVQRYFRTTADLQAKVDEIRAGRTGEYDCLMLLSGGKDSTYVLAQLVQMGLKVLAFSLDNGYISEDALANVRRVTNHLGVDLVIGRSPHMRIILADSLERYSNVCHGCFKTIYTLSINLARQKGIKAIVTGLSRGQLFETRLHELFRNRIFDVDDMDRAILEARKLYHRVDDAVFRLLDVEVFQDDRVFGEIEFVDYFRYSDVSLAQMYAFLAEHVPWVRPEDTGRSTNCLINEAGIYVHQTERGYHNYALPYSWDVRLGHKRRADTLQELDDDLRMPMVKQMLAEIGYQIKYRHHERSEKRLAAYYVSETPLSVSRLREFMAQIVPEYMVPFAFVRLEQLPLTANGKVDRGQLPVPDERRPLLSSAYVAPRNPIETNLAHIWADALHVKNLGVHDNFFDLGGNSVPAVQVIARIAQTFGLNLPIRSIFEAPTIAELGEIVAARLEREPAEGQATRPIKSLPEKAPKPLSSAQERLWFLHQLDPDSTAYNMHETLYLHGRLDVAALTYGINQVVARHESLRTTIAVDADRPLLHVRRPARLEVPVVDLRSLPAADRLAGAEKRAVAEAKRPFDLTTGPLVRLMLIQMAEEEYFLLLTTHHIVSDEWSTELLLAELSTFYSGAVENRPPNLPQLPVQYADFAAWQREMVAGGMLATQAEYWKHRLAGELPLLALPADRPRPARQSFSGKLLGHTLSPELTSALRRLSREADVTMFMLLLAAFKAWLHRLTGQQDIIVGTPVVNRNRPETRDLIGLFLNTVAMRSEVLPSLPFSHLLDQVRTTAMDALANQDLPFEKVVELVQPERDASVSPIFQVMFVHQNEAADRLQLPGMRVKPRQVDGGVAKFDLTLFVTETDNSLETAIEFNSDLFDEVTIRRWLQHLQTMLTGILQDPEQLIGRLPLVAADERRRLLVEWNETKSTVPQESCIHHLFEAKACEQPDAVALRFRDQVLTYRQLDRRANRLAHTLQASGVAAGVPVLIFAERSIDMIVAILGTLKAGGAYVPLDPGYPRERVEFVLADSRAPVILTQPALQDRLPATTAGVILVDQDGVEERNTPVQSPISSVGAGDPAYIIYTSGSTGRPKGVVVGHAQLVHSTRARLDYYPEDGQVTRFLLLSSFAFDSSLVGIFGTLCQGGELVLPGPEQERDVLTLASLIEAQGVTRLLSLPSLYRVLLEEADGRRLQSLKTVIVAGEACPPDLPRQHQAAMPAARLYNEYGPTEGTVWSTVFAMPPSGMMDPVPIGRPIANTQTYVLDAEMQLVPIGVPGELCVAGPGVALGYLRRPGLTAERFVPNPFAAEPGARLYRTGDLVRYQADGNLLFLGRVDNQVKIRGYRIELDEIATVLAQHHGVKESVVVARTGEGGVPALHAYVVPGPSAGTDRAGWVKFLTGRLPHYMIPAAFVALEAIPRTPNGKLDQRALPEADGLWSPTGTGFVPPRSEVETAMAAIWADVLQLDRIGIHDNFFELGGHSLLATRIVARLQRQLGLKLPLRRLFDRPTIAELAPLLDSDGSEASSASLPTIKAVARRRQQRSS